MKYAFCLAVAVLVSGCLCPSERWSVDRRGRMEPTYGASGTREGDRKAPEPSVSGRVETRTSSDRS